MNSREIGDRSSGQVLLGSPDVRALENERQIDHAPRGLDVSASDDLSARVASIQLSSNFRPMIFFSNCNWKGALESRLIIFISGKLEGEI